MLLVGLVVSSLPGAAQVNPRFESLWLEHGLPDKTVRAIAQDEQGFMWFGTTYGLARFDGHRMVIFAADPSQPTALSHDRVSTLHRDAQGRLWIGTRGGLNRYRPEDRSFEVSRHDPERGDSLSSDAILAIEDDGAGVLWVGTTQGLDRFDPESGKVERFADRHPELHAGHVRALHRDLDGRLWIGTANGVFVLRPGAKHLKRLPLLSDLEAGPRVNAIVADAAGFVWVGTRGNGLWRWDPASQSAAGFDDVVSDDTIFSLATDEHGSLWVGSMEKGLYRRSSGGSWDHFQHDPGDATSLRDDAVLALHVDRSSTLWAGTFQAGVHRLSLPSLEFGRHDNGKNSLACLPSAVTNDVQLVGSGPLLIATDSGLAAVEPDTGECTIHRHHANQQSSLSSSVVLSLHPGAGDNVWVGTLRGLDRLNLATQRSQRVSAIRDVAVYALAGSESGILWVGTTDGIYRSRDGGFERLALPESVSSPLKVNSIAIDSAQQAWLGTNRGLLIASESMDRIDRSSHREQAALEEWVGAVHVDAADTVWVGVDGRALYGFPRVGNPWEAMRNGAELPKFERFGTILSDSAGDLWVGTPRGLFRINTVSREVTPFRASDGLQSDDFIGNATFQSSSGHIFLGGRRGFNVFHPDRVYVDDTAPGVSLTEFSRFNEPVSVGKEHQGFRLDAPIDQLETLTLSHRDYVFGFEFAALHFADPSRNLYEYRLHGFDPEWVRRGASRARATYTNLAPGDYVFQVRASNAHGTWNDEGARLAISVLPAPWATWWAYALYLVLATAAISLVFLYRTRALRSQARNLESRVQARTATIEALLDEKNDEMATLLHEFRTPLTLVLGPVKSVLGSVEEPAIQQKLSVVRRNGFRLLRMVDQLLHLEKVKVQKALPSEVQAVKPTVESIGDSFRELARESDVHVSVHTVEELWVRVAPDTLEKILFNLLSNAVKYTPPGGRIELSAVAESDQVHIVVRDSGVGIATEHQSRVFERYQRVPAAEMEQVNGAGIGLALVKDLAEAHGGMIQLESEVGEGSTFSLKLPRVPAPPPVLARRADAKWIDLELETLAEQLDMKGDGAEARHGLPIDGHARPSILIIEDNADMSRYIADILSTRYACRTAANGEQGLREAWEVIPDLIVSDIMMPEVDGYELLGRLKNDERSSHIPVVLLTARGDAQSRRRGWQERADGYLTKPFDEEELLLRVESLLEIREILRQRFAQEFAPGASEVDAVGKGLNPRDRDFVDKFRRMIAENYTDPELRLPQMTATLALSERPLQRKLKALLGRTPIEFLRAYRLEKAGELLRQDLLVAEVANRTGFSSQAYFATCFKAHFGVTPSKFRGQPN